MNIPGLDEIIEKLIQGGVDINAKNCLNYTALSIAAAFGK